MSNKKIKVQSSVLANVASIVESTVRTATSSADSTAYAARRAIMDADRAFKRHVKGQLRVKARAKV